MANGLQLLRGTSTQHSNYSDFKNGEITAVTDNTGKCTGELRVHDNTTTGGLSVGGPTEYAQLGLTSSVNQGNISFDSNQTTSSITILNQTITLLESGIYLILGSCTMNLDGEENSTIFTLNDASSVLVSAKDSIVRADATTTNSNMNINFIKQFNANDTVYFKAESLTNADATIDQSTHASILLLHRI